MKYSAWLSLISVINLAIIFTLSWSVASLLLLIFKLQGVSMVEISGQPLMIILCLVLSAVNTPLIAFPIVKFPERTKTTIVSCVIIPLVAMIAIGGIVIGLTVSNVLNSVLI